MSYLVAGQAKTAIWSGYFLVFHRELGGGVVGQALEGLYYLFWVLLFCFGATVVYITPMKLRKFYLQMLSAPLQYLIFLSGSCQHPTRSCVFHLL